MQVKDLIALLCQMNPEAQVHIMSRPKWPRENGLCGVVSRKEFADGIDFGEGCAREDVFLLEGDMLRYGTREAWTVGQMV